jgi:type I restriction enzyme R subunit
MNIQSEQALENNLILQLQGMKYEYVAIRNEAELLVNLKSQLEKHNKLILTNDEFARVLNHLNKGGVFERALTLRDKMHLVRDDGTNAYIEFFNTKEWCQNEFQVTNQVTVEGSYKNRYDVTILINGLPLVQIELKRRGLELKEAFNQTNRYQRHSYDSNYGLFQYIQLFVISNGVNTKYFSNNRKQSFKHTSFWTDVNNVKITKLEEFAQVFLERCQLAKLIANYIVLTHDKTPMILRPYQYYAVEAIIDRVKTSNKNGYIWHTTGSGKTLTSFKASQILIDIPEVDKVLFVVDRNDLDTQTIREFNNYQKDSVDTTDNTSKLVQQFSDDTKLIVTTIQKLNNAISNERHLIKMNQHKDKKIVFIFDECHRSQFGETHKKITSYFTNYQLFGFTGTPIFAENATGNAFGKRTTAQLFEKCLHKYVITDAISDENVLKFSVEYVGKYREKEGSKNEVDIEVEAIDIQELMESSKRLEKIVDYIIANHDRKTRSKDYSAIFAVSSVDVLTKYYELFKKKKEEGKHNLNITTIFTYAANEEDKDANGLLDEDIDISEQGPVNTHSRDKLESYIGDYNKTFGTNFTTKDTKSFYNYYRDIGEKLKNREKVDLPENRIDILLVVNMFLTGFDAKKINTLYVDKNLRYHGLLQAYSRTNRIIDERKSQGNIVVFRNLKKATDDAVALFSNKDAKEIIFIKPYEEYIQLFNESIQRLLELSPTPESVDNLFGEEAELQFVKAFRELLRLRNILITFADFKYSDTLINEQTFVDFTSKYLDLYSKVKSNNEKEKVSILNDVDFELELIRIDNINVDYILRLLAKLVNADIENSRKIIKTIMDTMSSDATLVSKKDLIKKFIDQNIPYIDNSDDVESEFNSFWKTEEFEAFSKLCQEEGINQAKLKELIDEYLFTGRKLRNEELVNALDVKPKILERGSIVKRVANRINDFIHTFIEGM